jgi:hypothetical protein
MQTPAVPPMITSVGGISRRTRQAVIEIRGSGCKSHGELTPGAVDAAEGWREVDGGLEMMPEAVGEGKGRRRTGVGLRVWARVWVGCG